MAADTPRPELTGQAHRWGQREGPRAPCSLATRPRTGDRHRATRACGSSGARHRQPIGRHGALHQFPQPSPLESGTPATISFTSPKLSRNASLPGALPRPPYVATTHLQVDAQVIQAHERCHRPHRSSRPAQRRRRRPELHCDVETHRRQRALRPAAPLVDRQPEPLRGRAPLTRHRSAYTHAVLLHPSGASPAAPSGAQASARPAPSAHIGRCGVPF